MAAPRRRSVADILSDIADVERELGEVPPHSASSESLEDALRRLRAELERRRAERT